MTDPAVEAAQRAWEAANEPLIPNMSLEQAAVAAAREALTPIRAWYEKWEGADPDEFDIHDLLNDVHALIYPSEDS